MSDAEMYKAMRAYIDLAVELGIEKKLVAIRAAAVPETRSVPVEGPPGKDGKDGASSTVPGPKGDAGERGEPGERGKSLSVHTSSAAPANPGMGDLWIVP